MIKKRMIITLICFLAAGMLFTACRKKEEDKQDNTTETTLTPTVTPAQSAEDTKDITSDAETTDETDTASESDYLSENEAINKIQDIIGERGYYFELVKSDVKIDNTDYYEYQISDSDGPIKPDVLVDKASGELLCLKPDGSTAPFADHPLYTEPKTEEETLNSADSGFSKEDALACLSKVSSKDLGLSGDLKEYKIIYDDWNTNIKGKDCYGINVYADDGDKSRSAGLFYVAVDGSVMYKFDALLDDFVELKSK
jgi:hypothetical protein